VLKLELCSPRIMTAPVNFFYNQDDLVLNCLSYLDVATLVKMKQVSKRWRDLCTRVIIDKCPTPRPFETVSELREDVAKYCMKIPEELEELACTRGYPINRWHVSKIQDMSMLFKDQRNFNEDISRWDTSNVDNMYEMFWGAKSFNQDISSWNTSNVTNMERMFWSATSFNQNISSWDISRVSNMIGMFECATSLDPSNASFRQNSTKKRTKECMFYW
jgi:surface protein